MQKRISSKKKIGLLVDRLINGEVLDLTDKLDYYLARQKILNGILWGEDEIKRRRNFKKSHHNFLESLYYSSKFQSSSYL